MSQGVRGTQGTQAPPEEALIGNAVMFDVFKGGVGKSALSLNLADRLAAKGNDVLYLDLDPNGHVTSVLGYDDAYYDDMHDYGFVVSEMKYYSKFDYEPEDLIFETDFGWDFVPSYEDMENFSGTLEDEPERHKLLARKFLLPLFEEGKYDYFVMDGGGERSAIADSGFYAGRRAMLPIIPGKEVISALNRTTKRVIQDFRERHGLEVLAVVPNMLSQRLDHQNKDRELLELLNTSETYKDLIPEFARVTEEEWEKIDAGELKRKPGIRQDSSIMNGISNGMPAAHYDPDCDQIEYFDELAEIVVNDGIQS